MIHKSCIGVIGNGCVVHSGQIIEEIDHLHERGLNLAGRLFISNRAHIVFDFHQMCDGLHEAEKSKKQQNIGTTKKVCRTQTFFFLLGHDTSLNAHNRLAA